ncbi:MAG: hypothetical protein AAFY25_05110 [Pseudomonadota bacterium]
MGGIAAPSTLLAEPEEGSGRDLAEKAGLPGRRLANGQHEVTYNHLTYLSDYQIFWLNEYRRDGKVVVPGFSGSMLQWIMFGLATDQKRFQRFMRRLRRITDIDERRAELENEAATLRRVIRDLQANVNALRARDNEGEDLTSQEFALLTDDVFRVTELTRYLSVIETWAEFPHEGNRS